MPPSGPLRIIAGPTGAGKSAIAMALAEREGAWIISADSRQVYRGFDIGTAKPTKDERYRVVHRGIDVADPGERYSAARWANEALDWIEEARAAGAPVLIVGGTGLWLRALVRPLAALPPLDAHERVRLEAELAPLGTEELRGRVEQVDPARAHLGRTQLLRALEVFTLTGTPLTTWHAASASPRRKARWLIVDPGAALQTRLSTRLGRMYADGWEREVEGLTRAVPGDAAAWNACGYREIRAAVLGERSREEARTAILVSTRQYAKRQRTWFRHQLTDEPEVLRLDPTADDALERAARWATAGGTGDDA